MCLRERLYRFSEFGRELAYDVEGVTASFLSDVEAKLIDSLQEGNTIDESIQTLQEAYGYKSEEVAEGLRHLKSSGLQASDLHEKAPR